MQKQELCTESGFYTSGTQLLSKQNQKELCKHLILCFYQMLFLSIIPLYSRNSSRIASIIPSTYWGSSISA